jgi:hypothetical protein
MGTDHRFEVRLAVESDALAINDILNQVGHFPQVGLKCDPWIDVVFLQLMLSPLSTPIFHQRGKLDCNRAAT